MSSRPKEWVAKKISATHLSWANVSSCGSFYWSLWPTYLLMKELPKDFIIFHSGHNISEKRDLTLHLDYCFEMLNSENMSASKALYPYFCFFLSKAAKNKLFFCRKKNFSSTALACFRFPIFPSSVVALQ